MRIFSYSLMLSLFLGSSMISANPLAPLSHRGSTNLVKPSTMKANCSGRVYPAYMLDEAAEKVCSQTSKGTHCGNFMPCYYIKKALPGMPSVSRYVGNHFPEHKSGGSLLKWPLLKKKFLERTQYFAIVYKEHNTGICQAIGAVKKINDKEYVPCTEIPNGGNREPIQEPLYESISKVFKTSDFGVGTPPPPRGMQRDERGQNK